MHTVYVGIGSNLGDRQGNILQALQKLRARTTVAAVSAFYETQPMAGAAGPAFLNLAARLETELEPAAFERFVRDVELAVGRQRTQHLAARPIDVDILLFDQLEQDFGRFAVPHPYLAERPFNLIPLAEIAPGLRLTPGAKTLEELAAALGASGVARKERGLHFLANRQEEAPEVRLSIDRAGVSSVKRLVRLQLGGRETLFNGEFTMVADL